MASKQPKRRMCPLLGCQNTIGPQQVMCRSHWLSVPKEIREAVWIKYRTAPGSSEHRAAVREAVWAAWQQEKLSNA